MSPHILLVEDDKELVRMLQLDLIAQGYEVTIARDGLDGLHQFHSVHPDLVVLDIALPLMDGRTVCQRIREVSDAPILMMTAHAVSEEEIVQGLNLGADEFMLKPLRPAEFQARIRALLRRSRAYEPNPSLATKYADCWRCSSRIRERSSAFNSFWNRSGALSTRANITTRAFMCHTFGARSSLT
jgi:DNA-binding response OmpR family regulator